MKKKNNNKRHRHRSFALYAVRPRNKEQPFFLAAVPALNLLGCTGQNIAQRNID